MKCFNHPEREAVATCQKCGKGLCRECAEKYTPCMCESCAVQTQRAKQQQALRKEEERKQKYKNALVDTRSEFIGTCVIGIVVMIGFTVFMGNPFNRPETYPTFMDCLLFFVTCFVFLSDGNLLHTCNRSFLLHYLEHFGFGLYL